jgi:signal transduction histidine kinase
MARTQYLPDRTPESAPRESAPDSGELPEALKGQLAVQAKLATLGTLTAGVAHDVKNSLNFVINFAELNGELLDDLRDLFPDGQMTDSARQITEDLEANSRIISDHAKSALQVMASTLRLGRTDPTGPRDCQVNLLVEQSAKLGYHGWRARHPDRQCEMSLELDKSDPVVHAWETELARLIINLVINACDAAGEQRTVRYAPHGSDARSGRAIVQVGHDDKTVTVSVRDNGPGIQPELRDRVFDPFFTTKGDADGTGLGLSICRDIAQRHGGHISHRPNPAGIGTEFSLTILTRPDLTEAGQ